MRTEGSFKNVPKAEKANTTAYKMKDIHRTQQY
jgi:hypothetical protein